MILRGDNNPDTGGILEHSPELVDLRIEKDEGPRKGMFSVAQPQILAIIRKR